MAKLNNTKSAKSAQVVKTIEQLRADLEVKKNDFLVAKRGHKMGELINPRVLTVTRKEIARLQTAIRAEEIARAKENK